MVVFWESGRCQGGESPVTAASVRRVWTQRDLVSLAGHVRMCDDR